VSHRQLERQFTREKERAAEQLSVAEEHYKRQIHMLEDRLKSTEKERNLMMVWIFSCSGNETYDLYFRDFDLFLK